MISRDCGHMSYIALLLDYMFAYLDNRLITPLDAEWQPFSIIKKLE